MLPVTQAAVVLSISAGVATLLSCAPPESSAGPTDAGASKQPAATQTTADYGPMAVVDEPDLGSLDAGTGTGELIIDERCVTLEADSGAEYILLWRKDNVKWSARDQGIQFTSGLGSAELGEGDRMSAGGRAVTNLAQERFHILNPVDKSCDGILFLVHSVSMSG